MRRANLGLAAGFLAVLTMALLVTVVAVFRADPTPQQWPLHCEYVDDFNTYRCTESEDD